MKPIDKLEDEELFDKIQGIFKIASAFAPFLLKRFWNPIKLFKFGKLGLSLKGDITSMKNVSNDKKIDYAVSALTKILIFRRENREEFEELFEALEDVVRKYDENPIEIKDSILKVME
ncbi:hypothetical protein DCO58_00835 [Helicobacter saguini]|uniref:Uncharacterized protein n=1 Tax=Helicobacter saguini TaxID=1548018 RepID=A0A347VR22_9HELI|nr:hypothetical protein [Helicobacter saguini]MWV63066.1 hypothetical protein [Helicobacter saguini]MWV66265.1 hypothetical protein [Helicobacter saguini]MWV68617.1 hypothetical protein [Helicobacter saguini]MWV71832.1 hypothetical protein [Helicobacter saguini]TLD95854.1 hypothetical protein LS64_000335 [Helicobacter saguini]